jgi:hypothetical protein
MGLGYVEGVTHDYVRHGTTTSFAALDIATGAVFTECKPRHRHQEFLSFLGRLDACIPEQLDVHLIVDNYSTHKTSQGTHMAGTAAPLSHSLHANVLFVAESSGGLVWPDHPARHSPRLLQQREGFDRKDRLICPALQSLASTLRLDRHSGFHLGKDLPTLFSYFRDTMLERVPSIMNCRSIQTIGAFRYKDKRCHQRPLGNFITLLPES